MKGISFLAKTHITFADVEKCFDNLWLDDSVKDIWQNGTNIRDAVMIKKLNEHAIASVKTPAGETKEIILENTVKQGGVYGPQLCCSSLDKINKMGRKIVTMYGPNIEVNAQIYVDDMESAGSHITANNTIYNCHRLEMSKKLIINTEEGKSGLLRVKGGRNDERIITTEVTRGKFKEVNEYKFLGTWIDESGTYMINVKKIKKRIPIMILTVKQMGSESAVGNMTVQTRLKLMETVVMPSVMYNIETYPTIKKDERIELEKMQHNILVQILEVPTSTPYLGILLELGMWLMEARTDYRRLMLYHRIVHSDEKRMIKKITEEQRKHKREGTWYDTIYKSLQKYDVTMKVQEVLKSKWKKEVKGKISAWNEKEVRQRSKDLSKTRTAREGEWGRKRYINESALGDVKEILRLRLHMMPLPCNYKKNVDDGNKCCLCKKSDKIRTEHYFRCNRTKRIRERCGVKENMMTSESTNDILKAAKYIRTITKMVL